MLKRIYDENPEVKEFEVKNKSKIKVFNSDAERHEFENGINRMFIKPENDDNGILIFNSKDAKNRRDNKQDYHNLCLHLRLKDKDGNIFIIRPTDIEMDYLKRFVEMCPEIHEYNTHFDNQGRKFHSKMVGEINE